MDIIGVVMQMEFGISPEIPAPAAALEVEEPAEAVVVLVARVQ